MTATAPNIALIIDVLAHIENEPERWDQSTWGRADTDPEEGLETCGSAFCVAGWAASSASVKARPPREISAIAQDLLGVSRFGEDECDDSDLFGSDNELATVYALSAERFGIDPDELAHQVKLRAETLRLAAAPAKAPVD